MTEVRLVRHSKSDYPNDALTREGINFAKMNASKFSGFDVAIASGKNRARQTITSIGYPDHIVNTSFNELEIESIKANSAHEYILQAHNTHPSLILETSKVLLEGLAELSSYKEKKVLIVSHNLALSSLMFALTGEIDSFEFLHGLDVSVNKKGTTQINSLFKL